MAHPTTELDRRFGIPDIARVAAGKGGLPKVNITTPAATGEIYLQGGQVTSWTPAGQPDVLFVSAASRFEATRAIRGGIPVCFPWFGNKADDPQAPAHGFVRSKAWELDAIEPTGAGVLVRVATTSDDETRAGWPFDFRLVLRATFGDALHLELIAENTGTTPFAFEEALHTYYAIGDVNAVRITGLDGVRYLDKVDAGQERVQSGEIAIGSETDRVYLETTGTVDIDDPALRRHIRAAKSHSHSTIVWNPWIDKARALADLQDDDWTRMVCVEAANVGPQAIALEPGQQHAMSLTVTVSPW